MMLSITLYTLIIVTVLQPTAPRFRVGAVFSCAAWAHELWLSDLDGFAYYGSAAAFDFMTGLALWFACARSTLCLRVHYIALASILVNMLGYSLWFWYAPHAPYDVMMVAVNAAAIAALLQRDYGHDMGANPMVWRGFGFHRDGAGCRHIRHDNEGKK